MCDIEAGYEGIETLELLALRTERDALKAEVERLTKLFVKLKKETLNTGKSSTLEVGDFHYFILNDIVTKALEEK